MKNLIILLIPFLTLCSLPEKAFSQQGQVKDIEQEDLQELGTSNVFRTKKTTETKGTPYLNPTFLKGEVILKGGAPTRSLHLRLNTEDHSVEIVRNEEIQLLETKKVEGFRIYTKEGDVLFKNGFKSDDNDITKLTFLRIIYGGNTKLVAHHASALQEDLPSYGSATQKNAYVSFLKYYIITPDGTFHKIKLSKDDILNTLSDKKQELKKVADEKDLNYDNEDDVEVLIRKYDKMTS